MEKEVLSEYLVELLLETLKEDGIKVIRFSDTSLHQTSAYDCLAIQIQDRNNKKRIFTVDIKEVKEVLRGEKNKFYTSLSKTLNPKLDIQVKASASRGKLQIFECWEYEDGKMVGSKYVNVAFLKEMGVIHSIKETKKAEEFFNSTLGFQFYQATPHTPLVNG